MRDIFGLVARPVEVYQVFMSSDLVWRTGSKSAANLSEAASRLANL